jgi:hypothetical protein
LENPIDGTMELKQHAPIGSLMLMKRIKEENQRQWVRTAIMPVM